MSSDIGETVVHLSRNPTYMRRTEDGPNRHPQYPVVYKVRWERGVGAMGMRRTRLCSDELPRPCFSCDAGPKNYCKDYWFEFKKEVEEIDAKMMALGDLIAERT